MALIKKGEYDEEIEQLKNDVQALQLSIGQITEAYKNYIKISRIGTIVYSASVLPFTLVCNGASDVLKSEFPDLWAVIGTFFGEATETTFTLPNLIDRIPWYKRNQTVGKKYSSKLPNIRGTVSGVDFLELSSTFGGAFYNAGNVSYTAGADGSGQSIKLGLDASRSNSIYADNVNFVQPPSVNLIPLIYYA